MKQHETTTVINIRESWINLFLQWQAFHSINPTFLSKRLRIQTLIATSEPSSSSPWRLGIWIEGKRRCIMISPDVSFKLSRYPCIYCIYQQKKEKTKRPRKWDREMCIKHVILYILMFACFMNLSSLTQHKKNPKRDPCLEDWAVGTRSQTLRAVPVLPCCDIVGIVGSRWSTKKRQICWWNADDSDDSTKYRCRWQFLIAVLEGNLLEILQLAVWDVRTSQISWSESDQSTLSFEVPSYSLL